MIVKTDRYVKRSVLIWERGYASNDKWTETVRRETWWLLWIIPLYRRDTVLNRQA